MKTICLSKINPILESRDAWNDLAGEHPFCNWEWMSSWYQNYASEYSCIQVAVFEENGNWHGMLPMVIVETRRGKQLRFASSGKACADYVGPIVRPESRDIVIPMMFEWLQQTLHDPERGLDLVEFDGARSDDAEMNELLQFFESDRHKVVRQPIEGCWVAELEPDWETFQSGTSKSFRRKIKKAARNQGLKEVDTMLIDDLGELDAIWPHFERLHQLRRSELGQEGCFSDPIFGPFLHSAIKKLMQNGRAFFVGATFEGTPFALMLLISGNDTTYMYQTGTDPELKHLEPGHLLGSLAVQQAISLGHQRFDYLRGDEPYKARWKTERVALDRVQIISRKLGSQIKHQLWQTGRAIKNWLPNSMTSYTS